MYFPDLGTTCQVDHGPYVRAVGWLSKDHPYPTGDPEPDFLAALREHVAQAWQPLAAAGQHLCELCERARSGANVWIPAVDAVFVAPALVAHYVEAHAYAPPDAFVRAVLACPPQGSHEYFALMRRFPALWRARSLYVGGTLVERLMRRIYPVIASISTLLATERPAAAQTQALVDW